MTDQNPPEQPQWQPPSPPSDQYSWTAPGSPAWSAPGVWQPMPVPSSARPRRVPTAVVWCLVVVVASVIAAASGYYVGLPHSRINSGLQTFKAALSGPCPTGRTGPDPSATSPAGGALLARVLPAPTGYKRITGDKQGVLSLKDYAHLLYGSDRSAQQRLVARCFQTAVHRDWASGGGTLISVWLIQFGTAADARSYILSTEQGDSSDPANSDVFHVSRVVDGLGLGTPKLDKYGNTFTHVLGDAGNVAIIIHIFVPARLDNSYAARVLQQQYTLLKSGSL